MNSVMLWRVEFLYIADKGRQFIVGRIFLTSSSFLKWNGSPGREAVGPPQLGVYKRSDTAEESPGNGRKLSQMMLRFGDVKCPIQLLYFLILSTILFHECVCFFSP